MINNRQGGRRRGRGGGQRQGGGGGGQGQRDSGNRIDSRARGNASQLYEKYKNMARDAQLSGDRVTTEYYLQFADHYFRVLSDQRGRFEDQGQQQRRLRDDFDQFDMDDDFGDEGEQVRAEEQVRATENEGRRPRSERNDGERRDRGDGERRDRGGERREREAANAQPAPRDGARPPRAVPVANDVEDVPADADGETVVAAEVAPAEPRRRGRPRKQPLATAPVNDDVDGGVVAFEADRLPPAIAPVSASEDQGEGEGEAEAPKPRRRRARAAGEVTQAG